ncbi:MAG: hypothetical protein DA328_07080 [Nitrososphaeraceae archaeon]|nr:hypothetical protein [Nitrososphaeraceae archaeon]
MAECIKIEEMYFTQLRRRFNRICNNLRDNYYKNKNNKNIDKSLTIVLDATSLTISGKGT